MKRFLTLLLLIIAMTTASAHDFYVDGIFYNINGNEATVTYAGNHSSEYSNEYTGAVNIPSSVTYNGTTYSVTTIGYEAFFGCSGLTSVTIPNSVTTIGYAAFNNCTGLTSVTIPNSVKWIRDRAFMGCSGLTSVTIGNSVTSIGEQAFYRCTGLTSVTIPNSVTSIGGGAFYGCRGLTSVTIPNSVTTIGEVAFYNCTGLTSVTIGNSVTTIGKDAFYGCSGLTSVTIPNSVTSIGTQAFFGCSGLTSVTIGNSVTTIGEMIFSGCTGLTSMVVESGNTKYDSRNNCNAIIETATNTLISGCKNTIISGSVTTIGEAAFYNCSGLTSVTIPNSVTTIGGYAFYFCSGLTSVTIPNSVTTIGREAFYECSGLNTVTITGKGEFYYLPYDNYQFKTINIGSEITSLYSSYGGFSPDVVNCYAETPPTCSWNTFNNYNGALHVPSASIAAYFTADYWSNFSNLVNDLTEKMTLDKTTAEIVKNETLALTATTQPAGGEVIWCSSDPLIATVDDDGIVSAIGVGQCYVFATLASNAAVYASCHVTVSYPEITLSLNEESLAMNLGEEHTLTATITPNDTGLTPSWSSTNSSIATVNNGVVKAVGEGECDIKVTVLDKIATCHVTVTGNVTIKLNMNNAYVGVNDILTVYPTCTPNLPVDFVVSSSNPSVAIARIVNRTNAPAQSSAPALAETIAIQIIGISNGVATITVASADGKATPATLVVRVGASSTHGDVNGDGNVTAADITELYNYLLGGDTSNNNFLDVNGDGVVTAADVTAVYDVLLGNWQDNPPTLDQQLIGDWVSYQGFNNEYETHYIFNSDYTGSYRFIMNGTVYDDRSFTWSLDGNILSVASAGNTSTFEIALEDDILHMTANGNTIEFHKVN